MRNREGQDECDSPGGRALVQQGLPHAQGGRGSHGEGDQRRHQPAAILPQPARPSSKGRLVPGLPLQLEQPGQVEGAGKRRKSARFLVVRKEVHPQRPPAETRRRIQALGHQEPVAEHNFNPERHHKEAGVHRGASLQGFRRSRQPLPVDQGHRRSLRRHEDHVAQEESAERS